MENSKTIRFEAVGQSKDALAKVLVKVQFEDMATPVLGHDLHMILHYLIPRRSQHPK